MINELILVCLFATLAGMIFKAIEEVYKWTSPTYINKKKLTRKIETLIAEETNLLDTPYIFPSDKQAAYQRINTLVSIREIINTL